METRTVRVGNRKLFLSQPLQNRPEVILVVSDDGRRVILGDDRPLDEYLATTNERQERTT